MIEVLASLIAVAEIALAAFGLGRPVVRALRIACEDRFAVAVWSVACGLLAAGMIWTMLGLAGALYWPVIVAITALACCWGMIELVIAWHDLLMSRLPQSPSPRASATADEPAPLRTRVIVAFMLILAGVACAGALVEALAPPTAGDALCYHLELPKIFLAERAIVHVPYSDHSTYPLLAEMWFGWGLALESGIAAQLIHWGLGVLYCLATVLLARPIIGRPWAWCAGAAALLVPGATAQMTAPLNDIAVAAFTTLALVAWRQATSEDGRRGDFVTAGLMIGGALAIKYVALLFVAAVAMAWLVVLARPSTLRRRIFRGAAIAGAVAGMIAGPWYARAAWYHHNPVYPFFSPPADEREAARDAAKRPLAWQPVHVLSAPWQLTMHPERFGGRGHQFGVLFLMSLPAVVLLRRLRGLNALLLVALVYGVLWYATRQNLRFLLPIVPVLSIAAVWLIIELQRFPRLPRYAAQALLGGALALGAAVPAYRCRDKLAVAVGLESREAFLLRAEPTFPAALLAGRLLPAGSRILSQDYRSFYFDAPVTRESVYRRRSNYPSRVESPEDLAPLLRAEGFTHLLLAESQGTSGIRYESALSRLADAQMAANADSSLECLVEYTFDDADGAKRRYRLVALGEPAGAGKSASERLADAARAHPAEPRR